jgi:hypothetical protein
VALRIRRAATADGILPAAVGYSYEFLGDAEVPVDRMQAWLDAEAAPGRFDEWPRGWNLSVPDANLPVRTVRALLAEVAGESFSRVEVSADRLTIRTMADKSGDVWLTHRGAIAVAFRLAGEFGGTARLVVVTATDAPTDAGFVVESSPTAHGCRSLSEAEARAARAGAAGQELDALMDEWIDALMPG